MTHSTIIPLAAAGCEIIANSALRASIVDYLSSDIKRALLEEFLNISHQFVTASSTVCAFLEEHPMERFSPCPCLFSFEECIKVPCWAISTA